MGQRFLGWRDVPVNRHRIGRSSGAAMPLIRQVFVGAAPGLDQDAFERKLYVIRRVFEAAVKAARRLLLRAEPVEPHLRLHRHADVDPDRAVLPGPHRSGGGVGDRAGLTRATAPTRFPAWDLAQPFRYMAHNGEINTLRGNRNYMRAREGTMRSARLRRRSAASSTRSCATGPRTRRSSTTCSSSWCLNGRELPEAILMMIPEAWENHAEMDPERRAYYEYHSFLMEPWDGPASIAFTDGRKIGAVLDRNGLRPVALTVTKDGLVVMASEVGVLDIAPEHVVRKGRLQPGRIFFVDLELGRIVEDEEIKARYVARHPVSRVGRDASRVARRPAARGSGVRTSAESGAATHAPAGVRVHQRGFEAADRADGRRRQVGDRLDGQRRGAGLSLGSPAHALSLLQAALRAGHEPGDGLDQRGHRDVPLLDARRREEPARGDAGARAHAARESADPRPTRSSSGSARSPCPASPRGRCRCCSRWPKRATGCALRSRRCAARRRRRCATA